MNKSSHKRLLSGIVPALPTPLDEMDRVDTRAAQSLTAFLIDKGVNGLFPVGTTGEMLRLSHSERKAMSEAVIEAADKRVPVYIQITAENTKASLELAKHAFEAGADGIGVLTPYYFHATEKDIEAYFSEIARSLPEDFPVYLYNIPQMAGNFVTTQTAARLYESHPNIVGIKYSQSDFEQALSYRGISPEFSILFGVDLLFLPSLSVGCNGLISGTGAVYPELFLAIRNQYHKHKAEQCVELQQIANQYIKAANYHGFAGLKEALAHRGVNAGKTRHPERALEGNDARALRELLTRLDEKYMDFIVSMLR